MHSFSRGPWHFDAERFVIHHKSHPNYELDLDDCTDPAVVLDWLTAFASKTWISDEDFGRLFRMLDEILGFFSNYCPSGKARSANPRVVVENWFERSVAR